MPDLNSERAKKQEIMANLKHLNLLGNSGNAGPSSQSGDDDMKSHTAHKSRSKDISEMFNLKEPSISESENLSAQEEQEQEKAKDLRS